MTYLYLLYTVVHVNTGLTAMFDDTLKKLLNGDSLSLQESEAAMEEVMTGGVSDVKLASWLTALKLKGETADEIGGCATAMNRHALKINCNDDSVVDIVGTGGDGAKTFNISTTVAFVVAGAGATVAKHGNRAVSSKSGAADVLSELGLNINLSPEKMEAALNDIGISFLFAPLLHPAMKYAMPVRRELKTRTIFNVLGPLCNPAETQRMLIGVYSQELCRIVAEAALKMGKKHIIVAHGSDGLDEITTTGITHICEVCNGNIDEYDIAPEQFGLERANPEDLSGGTPSENAAITRSILSGQLTGRKRDVVMLNAAVSLLTSGKVNSIEDGLASAGDSIDSGRASQKLESLAAFTQECKS